MLSYAAETWYIKLNKRDLKNISVPYHKAIKRICGIKFNDNNHECLKHFLAKKQIQLPSDYFTLETLA